jgi:hypothetical protein
MKADTLLRGQLYGYNKLVWSVRLLKVTESDLNAA